MTAPMTTEVPSRALEAASSAEMLRCQPRSFSSSGASMDMFIGSRAVSQGEPPTSSTGSRPLGCSWLALRQISTAVSRLFVSSRIAGKEPMIRA